MPMRLLPRTVRGTWVLAAAAWAAGCAAAWGLLPNAPRSTLRLPIDAELVGFGPNGDTVLVRHETSRRDSPSWADGGSWELCLLDRASGETVATLVDRLRGAARLRVLGISADHQTWLVDLETNPERLLYKLDLVARTATPLPSRLIELADNWRPTLSPDGLLCAFPNPIEHPGAIYSEAAQVELWDMTGNRSRAVLSGPYESIAFSADGRLMAAAEFRTGRVRVLDRETLAPRATVTGPTRHFVNRMSFSGDGKRLVAGFGPESVDQAWWFFRGERGGCIGLPTAGVADRFSELGLCGAEVGTVNRLGALADGRFAAGGSLVIAFDYADAGGGLRGFDAATGEPRFTVPARTPMDWDLSPDGRTLIIIPKEFRPGFVETFVRKLGVPWPFPAAGDGRSAQLFDTATGRALGALPAPGLDTYLDSRDYWLKADPWLPDGRTVAVPRDPGRNVWDLWDVPPRKSVTWFGVTAAGFAVPVSLAARRRARAIV
jgi:WD40 repeat protein